jgi:hypothetical protein
LIAKGIGFLVFAFVILLGITLIFAKAYLGLMYEDEVRQIFALDEPQIEALNYAVQTVTTVGYGNWVPETKEKNAELNRKILAVKSLSILFMLLSTPLLAFLTGLAVNLVSEGLRPASP